MPLSLEFISYVSYITASLGILGSSFIILTFFLFKETRSFGTQLVFCLAISDFIRATIWYPWDSNESLCIAQGVLTQFSEFASFMWVFCIAMCLFLTYFLGASEERLKKLLVWFHITCWGLSAVVAAVPFMGNKYGRIVEDNNWCWIRDLKDSERLLLYIPCLFIFLINSISFFLITIRLRQYKSFIRHELQRNMAFYLLSFVLSQAPTIANRLYGYFGPHTRVSLNATFQPLQGLFDAIAYGANDPSFTTNYKRIIVGLMTRAQYTHIDDQKSVHGELDFDYSYASSSNYNNVIN